MKTGTILKGIGGYYTVQYEENKRCVLRPRGKFRHKEERPLPGDRVRFDVPPPGTEGFFEEILPSGGTNAAARCSQCGRGLGRDLHAKTGRRFLAFG